MAMPRFAAATPKAGWLLRILNGGKFVGQGSLTGGTINIYGENAISLSGWAVFVDGSSVVNWYGGSIAVSNGAAFNIGVAGGGLFDIRTDASIENPNNNAGGFLVTNNGVIRKSVSPGGNNETFIDMLATFANGGIEEELQGTIRFRAP